MRRIIDQFEQTNVSGYSVMPIMAGRGHDSSWTADGQISNAYINGTGIPRAAI
jgi:hypothetical protein